MRELHVVAVSEDGRYAVLATSPEAARGGFRIALDATLAAALRGERLRPGQPEPPASTLTPKDIQARLRTGESADAIARSAGVPVARVERFAGPVLSEMARVIDAARQTRVARSRRGTSALPLGDAVAHNLDATGTVRPDSVAWTSLREEEGSWVVTVSWVARARQRSCSWRYDPADRSLVAVDGPSGALAHVADTAVPDHPRRRTTGAASGSAGRAAAGAASVPAKAAGQKAVGQKAARPRQAVQVKAVQVKAVRVKAVQVKAVPVRAARNAAATSVKAVSPAKASATKAATPAKEQPSVGGAPGRGARRKTALVKTTPVKTTPVKTTPVKTTPVTAKLHKANARQASPRKAGSLLIDPPNPRRAKVAPTLSIVQDPDRAVRGAQSARNGVRGRAAVPAWADVLLSTSPRTDEPGPDR